MFKIESVANRVERECPVGRQVGPGVESALFGCLTDAYM
jgi:hypothetical protein